MSRSRRALTPIGRRLGAAAAAACLAGGVAACDAGNNAPTLTQYHPAGDGVYTAAHGIRINDAYVLGAQLGFTLPAGGSAGFFVALFNEGSRDALVSASAPGTASSVTLPAGGVPLPSQQAADLTGPVPKIVLTGLTHALPGGTSVHIILNFQHAGTVTLNVPVLPRSGSYATFSRPPSPAPSATRTKGATPSPSPSTP